MHAEGKAISSTYKHEEKASLANEYFSSVMGTPQHQDERDLGGSECSSP